MDLENSITAYNMAVLDQNLSWTDALPCTNISDWKNNQINNGKMGPVSESMFGENSELVLPESFRTKASAKWMKYEATSYILKLYSIIFNH